jgi:hypothetical protein
MSPRKSSAKAMPSEKEYSPASVEKRFPPSMVYV